LRFFGSADEVRKAVHGDGGAGAKEYAGVAIPAIVGIFHAGISARIEVEDIHGAHVDADAALVAAVGIKR
jgi:hypothetical protein